MQAAAGAVGFGEGGEQMLEAAADGRQRDQAGWGHRLFFAAVRGQGAALFQSQEAAGKHHEGGVVVEAAPGAPLEVIQAEFLLALSQYERWVARCVGRRGTRAWMPTKQRPRPGATEPAA